MIKIIVICKYLSLRIYFLSTLLFQKIGTQGVLGIGVTVAAVNLKWHQNYIHWSGEVILRISSLYEEKKTTGTKIETLQYSPTRKNSSL